LGQVEGIEATLRRGRAFGGIATFVLATLSVGQIALALYQTTIVQSAGKLDFRHLPQELPLWTGIASIVLLIAFRTWSRFWLQESKRAFRYTYSIEPFEAIETAATDLRWLTTDISRRLSERIRRLTLLDDALARTDTSTDLSHIHISGSFGLREQRRGAGDRHWQIEVLPWIRIGQREAPARLAHRVTYRSTEWDSKTKPLLTELLPDDYEKLVERVYFSIATEIYKQIREDVQRKIDLLPGRRFRATAYFYEAEDYVRSNTLDAYADAVELYRRVIELYDPEWVELPSTTWRRLIKLIERWLAATARRVRIKGSLYWPRMARVQLMVARAYLGYANAQVYQHILASLSGQRVNAVFETKPAVERAIRRLESLPPHVEGLRVAKFDALVTKALVNSVLSARIDAFDNLESARATEPLRAEQDSRYLFVRGYLEPDVIQSLRFLRRAVDLDPEYEVAQFELARATDTLWRTRPRLERGVVQSAIKEYERVVDLNPGNIAAWASLAYTNWLLGKRDRAAQLYERGLEYKEIKRVTFVAQLDYGLARIAAERGKFLEAYRHYIDAVSAEMVQGASHGPQEDDRELAIIGDDMLIRFDAYARNVEKHWHKAGQDPAKSDEARVRDSVLAFVLTDFGKACFAHFVRTGDNDSLQRAREVLDRATEQKHGSRFVLTHFYQHLLNFEWVSESAWRDYVGDHILKVDSLDPNWVDGNLELVNFFARKSDALVTRWLEHYRLSAYAAASADAKRSYVAELRGESGGPSARFIDRPTRHAVSSAEDNARAVAARARADAANGQGDLAIEFETTARAIQDEWTAGALTWFGWTREQLQKRMKDWTDAITTAAEHAAGAAIERAKAAALLDSDGVGSASTDPHQIARDLEREAAGDELDLGTHGGIADDTQHSLLEFVDRVPKRMQNLLPHIALRKDGHVSLESFVGSHGGELKWERTFDELHVLGLKAWSKTQSKDVELQTLRHIRHHFKPQEYELIVRSLDLQNASRESQLHHATTIKSDRETWTRILESWLEGEPEFWRLTWIFPGAAGDPIFDRQRIAELLVRASKRRNVTPALLLNIGWWLESLNAKEALKVYGSLRDQLPETNRGDLMFELADRLAALSKVDESIRCYRLASEMPFRTREGEMHSDCHLRIAQLEWGRSNDTPMLTELEFLGSSNASPGWRSKMMGKVGQNPRSSSMLHFWLDDEERRWREANPEVLSDVVNAMMALLQVERGLYVAQNPRAADMLPIQTPVALEAHPGFFPQEADTPQVVRLFADSGLKAMYDRLGQRYGVRLPFPWIRHNPWLPEGTYRILIHEIPRAWDSTDPASFYDEAFIAAIERCLSENLDAFVGLQETRDLVEQWRRQDTARERIYDRIMSKPRREILLAEVLRALVREQISLEPLDDVLRAFVESRDSDVERMIGHVRASLPPTRLGFRSHAPQARLPYELEKRVVRLTRVDGNAGGANRQSEERRLRQRLLECVDLGDEMLVVREPSIRSKVRSLVRADLPRLVVLTQHEIAGRQLDGSWVGTRIS